MTIWIKIRRIDMSETSKEYWFASSAQENVKTNKRYSHLSVLKHGKERHQTLPKLFTIMHPLFIFVLCNTPVHPPLEAFVYHTISTLLTGKPNLFVLVYSLCLFPDEENKSLSYFPSHLFFFLSMWIRLQASFYTHHFVQQLTTVNLWHWDTLTNRFLLEQE